jgi:hypothetical protein
MENGPFLGIQDYLTLALFQAVHSGKLLILKIEVNFAFLLFLNIMFPLQYCQECLPCYQRLRICTCLP